MGKTSLALVAAHAAHRGGELPGGVAWLSCESGPSFEECLRQAARVFFGDGPGQESAAACSARVGEHLGRGGALLVLDNFETVAGDADLLRWLARLRPPAGVLVTTREVTPGLAGQVVPVGELERAEAVELFTARAAQAGLSAVDAGAAGELCAAVGDQPLAVELLATRAARVPLPRLLERLRRDLGVVSSGPDPTRPGRHHSARACFGLSFENLGPQARELLTRVSVLPGGAGCDLVAALSGGDDWDEAPGELVAASLWRLRGERYTAHPLVRQYALERLGDRRAEEERRVLAAVTALAEQMARRVRPGPGGPVGDGPGLDWFGAERGNLLACATLARHSGDGATARRLALAFTTFWNVRGHWTDAECLWRQALAASREAEDARDEARLLHWVGYALRKLGRWAEAEELFRQSAAQFRTLGDTAGEAHVVASLSRLYQLRGRITRSARLARQALAALSAARDEVGEVRALRYYGNARKSQRRWRQAEAAYLRALELARKCDRYAERALLNHLGDLRRAQRRWDEAEACYRQNLALAREAGDRTAEADVVCNLGTLYRHRRRWEEAEAAYRESLRINRETGDRVREGDTLTGLARLSAARGQLAEALGLAREALQVLRGTEDARKVAKVEKLVEEWSRPTPG
jgi:tetratricopeptide (TPR) repeat protein